VLASILGSDKSSRLISRLQDEKHLAINIDAFSYTPYFSGVFGISATTAPDKMDELKAAIFAEIKKLSAEDKIKNGELKRVVNQISTSYCRTMRSNGNISRMIGNSVLTYGTTEYINKYIENVSALTPEDLTRVAEKYLTEKNCTIVEQLPKDKIENAGPKDKATVESQVPELIKTQGRTEDHHFQGHETSIGRHLPDNSRRSDTGGQGQRRHHPDNGLHAHGGNEVIQ